MVTPHRLSCLDFMDGLKESRNAFKRNRGCVAHWSHKISPCFTESASGARKSQKSNNDESLRAGFAHDRRAEMGVASP